MVRQSVVFSNSISALAELQRRALDMPLMPIPASADCMVWNRVLRVAWVIQLARRRSSTVTSACASNG